MDHARIDPEPNGGTEVSADGGVATDDRTDERDEPYVKRSVRIQEKGAIYRVIIISQYGQFVSKSVSNPDLSSLSSRN